MQMDFNADFLHICSCLLKQHLCFCLKYFGVFEELKMGTRNQEHAFTDVTHMNGPINLRLPV